MARPIVYGPAGSTYVWSARLALAEKGVAHELVDVPVRRPPRSAASARHPFAKVPAFEHDGFALYETQAILRYIDEGFPVLAVAADRFALIRADEPDHRHRRRLCLAVDRRGHRVQPHAAPRLGLPVDEAAVVAALPRARLCLTEFARLKGERPFLAGDRDEPRRPDGRPAPVFFLAARPRARRRSPSIRACAPGSAPHRDPAELPAHKAARPMRRPP